MALVFLALGTVLIITGVKGDPTQLFTLIQNDFKNQANKKGYVYWMLAILVLGSIGYVDRFAKLSRALLLLVILVLLLHNQGFFAQLFKEFGISTGSTVGVAQNG